MPNNPLVDKALSLDQQAKTVRQEAITALQHERKNIDEQLRALGADAATKTEPPKAADPNKVCPVCKERGHDGRFHKKKATPPLPPPSAARPAPPTPK